MSQILIVASCNSDLDVEADFLLVKKPVGSHKSELTFDELARYLLSGSLKNRNIRLVSF